MFKSPKQLCASITKGNRKFFLQQVSFWGDEDVYASPRLGDDDDRASVGSALRKTRSVDASCLDVRSIAELGSPAQGLSRAKSDFNLQASSLNGDHGNLI